mmetsp:Transcript_19228/g.36826  ORF Transcript_19228/g.36826 Transcript_19228/m.36826 type:complete len:462 (-) Transcript_19228:374-1759(-)
MYPQTEILAVFLVNVVASCAGVKLTTETNSHFNKCIQDISECTALDLQFDGYTGTLPGSIWSLTGLTFLSLIGNDFSGQIPSSLGQLSRLEQAWFNTNNFNGQLPSQIGRLSLLTYLKLSENLFSGTIPTEIGHLTALRGLELGRNSFTGALPYEMTQLSLLTSLKLSQNRFTGKGLEFVDRMPMLEKLWLNDNIFSGTIPFALLYLHMCTSLSMDENAFTGTIPTVLGFLGSVEFLYLSKNYLSGTIPTELGMLTRLITLSLNDNKLTGSFPSELSTLSHMSRMTLSGNAGLCGPIPSDLPTCAPTDYGRMPIEPMPCGNKYSIPWCEGNTEMDSESASMSVQTCFAGMAVFVLCLVAASATLAWTRSRGRVSTNRQVDVADDLASVNLLEIGKHNRGDILDPSIVQATASITTQIGSVEHTPDPAVVECSAASSVSVRTTGYGALDNPSCVILEQQGKM